MVYNLNMPKIITTDTLSKQFRDVGFFLLYDARSVKQDTVIVLCQNGHEWVAHPGWILKKSGKCPYCFDTPRRRMTPPEYYSLAKRLNIEWLGPMCKARDKTNWRCLTCGHEWSAQYKQVKRTPTNGCPVCAVASRTGGNHSSWNGGRTGDHNRRRHVWNKTVADLSDEQWNKCLDYWKHGCAYSNINGDCFGPIQQDHFIPVVRGGGYTMSNILPACKFHNVSKRHWHPQQWLNKKYGNEISKEILEGIHAYFLAITGQLETLI